MVNRGEKKVRVHMNVVPRSTRNTNSGTENLTLKCKFKCYQFTYLPVYFFFASCGSLVPFPRANAQWVIHGFK